MPRRRPPRTYVRTFVSRKGLTTGTGGRNRGRSPRRRNGVTASHARPSKRSSSRPGGMARAITAGSTLQWAKRRCSQTCLSNHGRDGGSGWVLDVLRIVPVGGVDPWERGTHLPQRDPRVEERRERLRRMVSPHDLVRELLGLELPPLVGERPRPPLRQRRSLPPRGVAPWHRGARRTRSVRRANGPREQRVSPREATGRTVRTDGHERGFAGHAGHGLWRCAGPSNG